MKAIINATATAALSAAILLAALPADKARAGGFASTYTRHDFQKCAERRSPEPGVIEVRACAGHGGFSVVWTGEPDSGAVAFGKTTDKATDPGGPIPGLDTFFEARGTIEWRGPAGGPAKPVAAIVRYDTGPAIGRLSSSRLVVYRLAPRGRSCVMGVVKGDANAAARAIADRHAARFVCGRGRTILSRLRGSVPRFPDESLRQTRDLSG